MKHGLEFNNSKLDMMKDAIRGHNILNILTNETTILLSQTILYQVLEYRIEYKSENSDPRYEFK